jgi:hypothetical protein
MNAFELHSIDLQMVCCTKVSYVCFFVEKSRHAKLMSSLGESRNCNCVVENITLPDNAHLKAIEEEAAALFPAAKVLHLHQAVE